MDIENLESNDFRLSAKTLEFIVRAYAACGIEIRIREDEIHCGSSLTYYPYDVLSGWNRIIRAKSAKTGDLDRFIRYHFGGDGLNGCVRCHQYGLEVPTIRRNPPDFDNLLKTDGWKSAAANHDCIPILLGESVSGDAFVCELSNAPGANDVHMLAGGGLGAGMTQLMQNIITALHTCRTPDNLEIYVLHGSVGYFAFDKSPLVRCNASIPLIGGTSEAVAFMRQIERMITVRLREIAHDSETSLRDMLVIIDDFDNYRTGDGFAELKNLVERCVSCGRSARVHFIICVGDMSHKIINKDFYTTFFALHFTSHEDARRLLGNDIATKIKKGGEGLYRTGNFCHRVQIPMLSTDKQRTFVDFLSKEYSLASGAKVIKVKGGMSEDARASLDEIRSLAADLERKKAQYQELERLQHKALATFKTMVEASAHNKETVDSPKQATGAKKKNDCSLIDLLAFKNEKSMLQRIFGSLSGEECFNRGAEYYNVKRYSKALLWFRKSADKGCLEGQYRTGWMLAWGEYGTPQDGTLAETYLKKAAERGHVDAMIQLAFLYEDGRGIEKNPSTALHWFRLAAAKHDWAGEQGVKRLQSSSL